MILDGQYFTYGDFSSRMYGIIFAHVESSILSDMSGKISSSSVFNARKKVNYFTGNDYSSSPVSFEAEIVQESASAILEEERRAIEKALFNAPIYKKLRADLLNGGIESSLNVFDGLRASRMYFNCRMVNPSRIMNDRDETIGYKFTVECDSAYMWEDEASVSFSAEDISDGNGIIHVSADSDMQDYIYPTVTFTVGSTGGDITFQNNTDDSERLTTFKDVTHNTQIAMDGCRCMITPEENYSKFYAKNFIRLLDGDNSIAVTGDVSTVKFAFCNRSYIL